MIIALLLLAAPLDDATAVEVSGDVSVQIRIDKKTSQSEASGVDVAVTGGVVVVKGPARSDGARPVLRLTLSSLDSIEARGAARVSASGVTGKSLKVTAAGRSEVVVDGKSVQSLDVDASSSARVDVQKLPAASVNTTAGDAARVTVRAATGATVSATAKKAARITILGNPAKLEKHVEGAGKIM